MAKYFNQCETLEDVKQTFKKLAKELHPDNNPGTDTTAAFQEMQKEYTAAFNKLKNFHKNAAGETYTKETTETPEQFASIINELFKMSGLVVELCGSWLWVTGNTKEYKTELKALGFNWSKNKAAWYFHFEPYRKLSKVKHSLDDIRAMYGSETFKQGAREADPELLPA